MSLRKVFFNAENMVVALATVGSEESDVTYKASSHHRFITDDNLEIEVGSTFKNNKYIPYIKPVSYKQLKEGLVQSSLFDKVKDSTKLSFNWESVNLISRTDPSVKTMTEILNISEEAVDALFVLAFTLIIKE